MAASLNWVSRETRHSKQEMVVQQSADWQSLSEFAVMTGGTFERSFWTKFLSEKNLESPGREEAVEKTLEKIAYRKKLQQIKRDAKLNKKGKKK